MLSLDLRETAFLSKPIINYLISSCAFLCSTQLPNHSYVQLSTADTRTFEPVVSPTHVEAWVCHTGEKALTRYTLWVPHKVRSYSYSLHSSEPRAGVGKTRSILWYKALVDSGVWVHLEMNG